MAFTGIIIIGDNCIKPATSATSSPANLTAVKHIFSLKQSHLTPGFTTKPEWILVPPIFTADIPVGPQRRTHGLSGSLKW